MSKFCGKCGAKLNENGLCPNCDSDRIETEKASQKTTADNQRSVIDDSAQDNTSPKELTKKEKKVKEKADKAAAKVKKKADKKIAAVKAKANNKADGKSEKAAAKIANKADKKADKLAVKFDQKAEKKAAKAAKKASRPIGKKIGVFLLKLLAVVLAIVIIFSAVSGVLVYFGALDIPVITKLIDKFNYWDDVSYSPQIGYSYIPSEENIVYENEEKSRGYVNNMILVFFSKKAKVNEINEIIDSINGNVVGKIEGVNQYQIQVNPTSKEKLEIICDELLKEDIVNNAMIDIVITTSNNNIPNDPWKDTFQGLLGVDWNEDKPDGTNWWVEATRVLSAWNSNDHFSNIKVGIVDNGFDTKHEDIGISVINNEVNNYENHGTHVAGVIGARVNNNLGISGVLENVSLYGVDCYSTNKQEKENITVSSLFNGINLCIQNGCKVINMSSGIEYDNEDETRKSAKETAIYATQYLISLLDSYREDFIIVQSAGNGDDWGRGVNAKEYNGYFCGIDNDLVESVFESFKEKGQKTDNIISTEDVMNSFMIVAAVDKDKKKDDYQLSNFSNYGEAITVCAPGVQIFSTIKSGGLDGSYGYMDGTSMAAPITSGITALAWSVNPNMSSCEIKRIITSTATKKVLPRRKKDVGSYTMIDAEAAVKEVVKRTSQTSEANQDSETVFPLNGSSERDIVLVLDTSGSMYGTPLDETKKASTNFVDTILEEDASIGVVNYDDEAYIASDFSNSKNTLDSIINDLETGGGTDIEAGLRTADQMLTQSSAKKKIIVLMSDGEPNDGLLGDELIAYADELKNKGIYIYTLGFFEDLGDKTEAQALMEKIASEGCHYEVSDADSLVFFFGDIADQINGQKYIYVRIACPVDVSVEYNGETLDSSDTGLSTRTSFGTLTFEDSKSDTDSDEYSEEYDSTENDKVKILRLKEGENYDIKIEGTGRGRMDYSIGFMDEEGEYSDFRKFNNIRITRSTQIDTVAEVSDKTVLNVDEDGDGKYDTVYQAKANGYGEIVDYSYLFYILVGLVSFLVLLIIVLIISNKIKKSKNKKSN